MTWQLLSSARRWGLPAAMIALLAACNGGGGQAFAEYDNTDEVEEYYRADPNFFRVASLADLPEGLNWEDGADLPEIGSPKAKKGGTFRGRIQDFPRTLRNVGPDANSSFRPYIHDDISMGLAQLHPNVAGPHRYFAALANQWAIDKENRTVYVRLDPAARWSDGNPVTTDDFFFMFYFYQSPHIQAPWYNNWYGKDINYTSITRYDDHTFAITTKEQRPNMPEMVLGLRPVPREYYRDFGPDFVERYQWRFAPTTGAYVVTDDELSRIRTDRNSISLTRLDDWWAKDKKNFRYRFNPDQILLRVIRDTPKAFESALAAELDFVAPMTLAEYWYDQFPNTHPLVQRGLVHKTVFYNDIPRPTYGLWMNSAMPLLDNHEVRLGIQYASNWQLVIDQYFRGDYSRMNTTADGFGDFTHPTVKARPFDIAEAGKHFANAGFTQRGPDGVLVNAQGQRLSVKLSTGYEALAPVLNILRQEALKAGLEFRVEVLDASAEWKMVQEKNHDITFSAFAVGVEQFPRYWETYHSANAYDQPFVEDGRVKLPNPNRKAKPQTNNLMSIAIPELDDLIDRYDNSTDLDEMRRLAFHMEEIIYEDASFSPGFVMPGFRTAYWRWMQFPDDFNVRFAADAIEYYLFWIDQDIQEETMRARRGTDSFPVGIHVYDQWRVN